MLEGIIIFGAIGWGAIVGLLSLYSAIYWTIKNKTPILFLFGLILFCGELLISLFFWKPDDLVGLSTRVIVWQGVFAFVLRWTMSIFGNDKFKKIATVIHVAVAFWALALALSLFFGGADFLSDLFGRSIIRGLNVR
jgi:hypothetical protein